MTTPIRPPSLLYKTKPKNPPNFLQFTHPLPSYFLDQKGGNYVIYIIFCKLINLKQQGFQFAQLQISWNSLLISWMMMMKKKPSSISSLLPHHSQSVLVYTLGYRMECSLCVKLQKYPSEYVTKTAKLNILQPPHMHIKYNSVCLFRHVDFISKLGLDGTTLYV